MAKAAFTRSGNWLTNLIEGDRKGPEVSQALSKVKEAFEKLIRKHENHSELLESDTEFETEEAWMGECATAFMGLEMDTSKYLDKLAKEYTEQGKGPMKNLSSNLQSAEVNQQSPLLVNGMIGMHSAEAAIYVNESAVEQSPSNTNGMIGMQSEEGGMAAMTAVSDNNTIPSTSAAQAIQQSDQTANFGSQPSRQDSCPFKMEKPKLPKFSGDVREYAIFRADFIHAIDKRYSKRDAITFLRTCLLDKPLELIKGIGSDYDACWEYLDSIYGDPRYVSDTIIQDIIKFRALQPTEDARFCDLVHLVRRSYNTLKEVGTENDMNNSHMLSVIEQKLCLDDRKVWSREVERDGKHATLNALIHWMTIEMKSRMRATAPLRSGI